LKKKKKGRNGKITRELKQKDDDKKKEHKDYEKEKKEQG